MMTQRTRNASKFGTFVFAAIAFFTLLHCSKSSPVGPTTGAPVSSVPEFVDDAKSGLGSRLSEILSNNRIFKSQPNPYPAPSIVDPLGSNIGLFSSPTLPVANQADLLLVDEMGAERAQDIRHVLQSFLVPAGKANFKPIAPPGFANDPELLKSMNRNKGSSFYGTLLPHALERLAKDGQLTLPILHGRDERFYRVQGVCVARKNRQCERYLLTVLSHELGGSAAVLPLLPVLRWDPKQFSIGAEEEVRVWYAAFDGAKVVADSLKDPIATAVANRSLVHPGDNPHVNEFLNRSLVWYMSRFAAGKSTPILDFVLRMHLADCKLTSMAQTEYLREKLKGRPGLGFYVASGNVPPTNPRTLDITTANHVWNYLAETYADGSIAFDKTSQWDLTPPADPILTFTFTADNLNELVKRLDAKTIDADFHLDSVMEISSRQKLGAPDTDADFQKAVRDAMSAAFQQFPTAVDKKVQFRVMELLFSWGNPGEVALVGKTPRAVFTAEVSNAFNLMNESILLQGFRSRDRKQFIADIYEGGETLEGYEYPESIVKLDGYEYGRKLTNFFAAKLGPAEVASYLEKLEKVRFSTTSSYRPRVDRSGMVYVGPLGSFPLVQPERLGKTNLANFWKTQGIPSTPVFEISLKMLVHPK